MVSKEYPGCMYMGLNSTGPKVGKGCWLGWRWGGKLFFVLLHAVDEISVGKE